MDLRDIYGTKQDTLVSGVNIKTVNGETVLGSSDIDTRSARVQSVASAATVTPTSANDLVKITAQAAALALANPTGTFTEGQDFMIRIKDNGTARAITFDTKYRAVGVTLPTTTTISKTMYLGVIYNATDDKFDVLATPTEA
jgi:Flp pilus assembly secretin CpaC